MTQINRIITLTFSALCLIANAQKGLSPADRLRLSTANDNYRLEYYPEAYVQYMGLVRDNPGQAQLKVLQARAGLSLHRYTEVLPLLEEAWKQDSTAHADLPLLLGMAYHRNGMLPQASQWYQKFKSRLKGKALQNHEVNQYLREVETARLQMEQPTRARLTPMTSINTEHMENTACLSADGQVMVFTTARPENKGSGTDPHLGIAFQDIWWMAKDSATGVWEEPFPLPGEINTTGHDAALSVSPDGNIIFLFSSKTGGGDIYYSRAKKNGVFRTPVPLDGDLNSSYFESSLSLAADGKSVIYISEKPVKGTLGQGDLWTATRKGKFGFEEARPLGAIVNSPFDENSAYLHPDGKTLYFSSNRPGGMGGYDIYFSRLVNGAWTKPVNMGYPINSVGDESYFYVNTEGNTGYVTSRRPESMDYSFDIFEVDLGDYIYPDVAGTNQEASTPTVSVFKGKVMAQATAEPLSVTLVVKDTTGKVVQEVESGESGNFLSTLPGNLTYEVEIRANGFKPLTEQVFVPETPGKTSYAIRVFLLIHE